MGKGSSSSNNTAVKSARAITIGAEAGGGTSDQSVNVCRLQFTMSTLLPASLGIAIGDPVAIVPNATDSGRLDLVIGRVTAGIYDGEFRERIIDCIGQNYSYRGTVTDVKAMGPALEVICAVRWHTYE